MWSMKKPTEDGYYWMRSPGQLSGRPYVRPVHLYSSNKESPQNTVFSDGENIEANREEYEWWTEKIIKPN